MDPEPESHDPTETPSPVPQPMVMERTLSESGSNSSVSTVYFKKGSKEGSAASSRSGSVASTSRSPPHEPEVPARSSPSPSFGQGQLGEARDKDHGDQPPFTTLVTPSSEEEKIHFVDEKTNESVQIETTKELKEDIVRAFQQQSKPSPTGTIDALKKGSDQIVSEVARTETIILKEVEHAVADECCSCCQCCRSCATWGLAGDVAAILCCPFTVISLLSCMCFRCPKFFASRAAEKARSKKSPTKEEHPQANKEESEFEESTGTKQGASAPGTKKGGSQASAKGTKKGGSQVNAKGTKKGGSQASASTTKHIHSAGHREEKPAVTPQTKLKSPGSESEKLKGPEAEVDAQRNYSFPSPGVEDDHPGGDKPGGR